MTDTGLSLATPASRPGVIMAAALRPPAQTVRTAYDQLCAAPKRAGQGKRSAKSA